MSSKLADRLAALEAERSARTRRTVGRLLRNAARVAAALVLIIGAVLALGLALGSTLF